MKIQQITITKVPAKHVGEVIKWNFDLNGIAFGQIYTFKASKGLVNMFHASTLAGAYEQFTSYKAAETFIRGEM